MSGQGPYLQRVEMRGGTWFARTLVIAASGQAVAQQTVAHESRGAEALVNRGNTQRQQRSRYPRACKTASGPPSLTTNPDVKEWVSIKSCE